MYTLDLRRLKMDLMITAETLTTQGDAQHKPLAEIITAMLASLPEIEKILLAGGGKPITFGAPAQRPRGHRILHEGVALSKTKIENPEGLIRETRNRRF